MRGYVLLVALAVAASAAPRSHVVPSSDLTKKLTEVVKEALKDPQVVDSSGENELDQVNSASEVEINNLRKGETVQSIPVKVISEDVKPVEDKKAVVKNTFGIVRNNDEVTPDIDRAEVDLKHPGNPQRQEHDTQSPEDINQEQGSIEIIKQGIAESHITLRQGIQGITQEIQNFVAGNEQLSIIKDSIQTLHENFNKQLANLNNTISEVFNGVASTENESEQSVVKKEEAGVKGLLKGVESVKQDSTDSSSSGSTDSNGGGGNTWITQFQNYLSQFQNNVQESFNNMSTLLQNNNNFNTANGSIFQNFGQGPQTNVESDETQNNRPGIWENIQNTIQNIWRPGQNNGGQDQVQSDQQAPAPAAPGPFVQAIQNNPLVQGFQNLLNRPQGTNKPPVAPVKPAEAPADVTQEGSNALPQQSEPSAEKPAGPIQQIVQKNPIVQGIAGAVQRIQTTINNPEKPRERGHGYGGGYGGGGGAAVGDSDDSNGVAAKKEPVKEDVPKRENEKEMKKPCDKQKEGEKEKELPAPAKTD